MNKKTKLELADTMPVILFKISEGNPGALSVLVRIVKESPVIDPDSAMAGLGPLLDFDTMGLYGSKIWLLYKDVCQYDLTRMLGLLRARQLGLLPEKFILDAIEAADTGQRAKIPHTDNLDVIVFKVKDRLPKFAKDFNPPGFSKSSPSPKQVDSQDGTTVTE